MQNNDPDKGAAAIIEAIKAEHPPLHLLPGADALELTRKQLAAMAAEFDAWETLTRSTAFDETAKPAAVHDTRHASPCAKVGQRSLGGFGVRF